MDKQQQQKGVRGATLQERLQAKDFTRATSKRQRRSAVATVGLLARHEDFTRKQAEK